MTKPAPRGQVARHKSLVISIVYQFQFFSYPDVCGGFSKDDVIETRGGHQRQALRHAMTAVVENKLQKIYDREGRNTSSRDPKLMNARVFLGNFPAEGMERKEVEEIFSVFGKVLGISLHKTYGFVQYDNDENANAAVNEWHGKVFKGKKLGEF